MLLLLSPTLIGGAANAQAVLQSDDRIAIVGSTFVERARLYGHLETNLQLAAGPDVTNLQFRNLGWSGDTVFGDARSYFGPPREGRNRLDKVISELRPTVLVLCYGTAPAISDRQAWTGEPTAKLMTDSGLDATQKSFAQGYQSLVDRAIKAAGGSIRQLVFIAPPPFESLGPPLPSQSSNNRRLAAIRDTIRQLAEKNKGHFVDLFHTLGGDDFRDEPPEKPLTHNGIHHTEAGYQIIANELAKGLGLKRSASIELDSKPVDELRDLVIEKNRLYFNRWRPSNETYLFLFRAHEQGNNAAEIPQFDPLIAEQEKKIEVARQRIFESQPNQ